MTSWVRTDSPYEEVQVPRVSDSDDVMSGNRWALLIASESGDADPASHQAMERLREAIEQRGHNVIRTFT